MSGMSEGAAVQVIPPAAKAMPGLPYDHSLELNDSARCLNVEAQQPVEGTSFKLA